MSSRISQAPRLGKYFMLVDNMLVGIALGLRQLVQQGLGILAVLGYAGGGWLFDAGKALNRDGRTRRLKLCVVTIQRILLVRIRLTGHAALCQDESKATC